MLRRWPRTWRFGWIVALAGACGSCASGSGGDAPTAEQLQAKPTPALCELVAETKSGKALVLQELLARHAIGSDHVAALIGNTVVVGMNSCETIAAWGMPTRYSNTVGMDYGNGAAVAKAAMVYEYFSTGLVDFDAQGRVIGVVRY
jgi:hypothetical protein